MTRDYKDNGDYKCPGCGFKYHEDNFDNDYSNERLPIDEIAAIGASHGIDEDYRFGYTENN
ncbi:hypothetical protein QJ036_04800 [Ruminococcus sp. YH-rum2234]|uniref:Uncharacterized protein n=1 Tax=Fusibacillus kribbianus TaxID=3044208 RepID=A0AAP4B9Y8_9FIRM|nr:hypothetical protein [Ruminococcus sp. YH-rum2234]